ncbi:flavodoxin family protein [Actinoplanes sp. N902-109]|uniref:flavodoxin family protein n=1 Tax=Actinoplanes sp. (strain N902-109) TaxID=649831 RepID=UPI00032962B7|nr:NAD(P)H-dependent oxidoreductase [Actinoplanes sp. N902-109]AGL17114.1 NADPH-dependent FMN reductase [Actinoplanes sp. N902-109]
MLADDEAIATAVALLAGAHGLIGPDAAVRALELARACRDEVEVGFGCCRDTTGRRFLRGDQWGAAAGVRRLTVPAHRAVCAGRGGASGCMADSQTLRALVLGCSLKSTSQQSSSELLGREVLDALADHDVDGEVLRVADLGVKFGVSTDEGDGDGWPAVREKILAAQILVIATPIWMGQPSSVAKMVLERLDAELAETDDRGRPSMYDKVGVVAVVGNEDGAHHVSAEVFQALNDVGFSIPAGGVTYWVGEAMGSEDYQDAGPKPDTTGTTTKTLAANAAHLARLLAATPYPAS